MDEFLQLELDSSSSRIVIEKKDKKNHMVKWSMYVDNETPIQI